jgi:hypothetical protein
LLTEIVYPLVNYVCLVVRVNCIISIGHRKVSKHNFKHEVNLSTLYPLLPHVAPKLSNRLELS